jgi:hypothetical protein
VCDRSVQAPPDAMKTAARVSAGMDDVVIVLPLVVLILVLGLRTDSPAIILLLPVVLAGGGAALVINKVLREGRRPPDRSVRQLPTNHLRRQMYMALRPRRPKRPQERDDE